MLKVLFRARDRFCRNQSGNVAILFAFSAIPLIGLLGGAVDLTRHSRYRTQLMNAMDAAAVALVRRGAEDDEDADRFVNDFIAAMLPHLGVGAGASAPKAMAGRMAKAAGNPGKASGDAMLHMKAFNATELENGYRIQSDGYMETAFMPVVGIYDMPLDLQSEIMESTGNYEVALVLDNTGSMASHGRMPALREAAGNLVTDLYKEEGTEDRVKMSLVPFVTSVNIRSTNPDAFDMAWIDPVGEDQDAYGVNFSEKVNRLNLFASMGARWKGCVEARVDAIEDNDVAFDSRKPDTKWVPYLWPDEPDTGAYGNSYIADSATGSDWDRLRGAAKYNRKGKSVADTTSRGPNAACPRGIVELTNDTDRLQEEIALMKPHNTSGGNSSGTNVEQGLLWGWRTLSPDAPFDQGASYKDKETTKVLVLLSDGRNQIVSRQGDDRVTKSDYTSYGYLAAGRLGSKTNYLKAEKRVDEKVKRVCEKVKGTGIRVYTILFQVDFEETQEVFRDCASRDEKGKPLYFYIPNAGALETAFKAIGEDLTNIHIAR